ncbi:MAG: hypothetical protein M3Z26_15620 [Bacteroidota bacterium]|nr:hypothetical protein [Bacteroidota bacterium]
MKIKIELLILSAFLLSCGAGIQHDAANQEKVPIEGTWKLISGTTIQKNDTVTTNYTKERSFIKIINGTHFSFLEHDLDKGKNKDSVFTAGGGSYSLNGNSYTERLEYCSDRAWEGHDFNFTIKIENDTLTQSGIEKIDSLGVNRINIEKYIRVKN